MNSDETLENMLHDRLVCGGLSAHNIHEKLIEKADSASETAISSTSSKAEELQPNWYVSVKNVTVMSVSIK